jgi:hypothetical protein
VKRRQHYREGESVAHVVWHAIWLEEQPIVHCVLAVGFKVTVPAGVTADGTGMKQPV